MQLKQVFKNARIESRNTSPEVYHKANHDRGNPHFAMSRSDLVEFNRCPERWVKGYSFEETAATEWGTIADCLILQPALFNKRFAIEPATYPATPKKKGDPIEQKDWNTNAHYCADWEAERESEGKTVVKNKHYQTARRAADRILADPEISSLIRQSKTSVMLTADYLDAETKVNVPVKILIDLEPEKGGTFDDSLADLKTSMNASQGFWRRRVFDHNLHIQAAFYLDIYNAATGEERNTFRHALLESFEPFQPGKRFLSGDFIEIGRMKYREYLARYAQCLKADKWPGYEDGARMLSGGWACTEPEPWMINA